MMKTIITTLVFLFSLNGFSQTYSFTHNSIVRSYIVHLPTGYTTSTQYPLVINMHGYTSTAAQQQTYSQMDVVADTAKFIVVYPDGVNNAWNAGFGTNPTIDDVGFLSALIDTMKAKFSVNALKIYSCGLSNGGFMSFRLACELESKIAAIAPVAGLMSDSTRLFCQNICPVPVIYFHGTTDAIVNYNGAPGYVSTDSTIKIWVGKDGCPTTPVVTNMPDINPGDGCTATRYVYSPGQNNSAVVLFKITNGGHTWPGGFPIPSFGNTNQDIKASGEIWKFFRNHTLQCGSNGTEEPGKNDPLVVYPNPASGSIILNSKDGKIKTATFYNVLGENIMMQVGPGPDLDISSFENGIYFLKIETDKGISFSKIIKQ